MRRIAKKPTLNLYSVIPIISFCNANGWTVDKVVKEIGSGLNDNRKQLTKILHDGIVSRLVVEHQDRFTRFGCNYIELICRHINCELIVVNPPQDEKEDLIEDFVSIITSFCARIYGHRRSKRKTEEIIKSIKDDQALQKN